MNKKLTKIRQYYSFLQKIQFLVVARFLLYVVPVNFFLKSDTYFSYFNPVIEKYSIPDFMLTFFGFFIISILYVHAVMYVFQNFLFKRYAIHRSSKVLDDIRFAIVYTTLLAISGLLVQQLLDYDWYKVASVYFIQTPIFYFLFKIKAFNYFVEKLEHPLQT
jgi:hypothetical protein